MHHRSARRLFAGPAVAVAAALALAAPAHAAAGAKISFELSGTTVGVGAQAPIDTVLGADKAVTLTSASVTYELSGDLTGVSLVSEDAYCESFSESQLVCERPFEFELDPDGLSNVFDAALKASGSAVAGATGTLTATFSADGVTPVKATADVKVADDVDLAAGKSYELDLKPGAAFELPLEITNTTGTVAHGAGLRAHADYAYEATERFSNCVYREDDRLAGCLFAQDLELGTTYRVVLPFRLREDTAAPSGNGGEFEWLTADDYTDRIATKDTSAGPALRLEPVVSAKRAPQTDSDPEDNWQTVTVNATGKQGSDVAAVGTTVSGKAGDVVKATVGLRNNGPATIDSSRSAEWASVALVTIPEGTTATAVPKSCYLAEYDKTDPDAVQYYCASDYVFRAGQTVKWTFGLRIDKVHADATGAVESNPACQCSRFSEDLDRSNDKAKLVVNPTEAGNPAGGTPGTGTGDDEGGGEPGLPITGPQGAALAVTGVLLLVAGVAGFLVARKRRTRFEA
ncbi:hypothetical protein AB0C07_25705 [Actinoplanes missouriensis]|uniref:hypothetical protein n=1 Tax=Actinoplanes missouriensis TaxID=1866 RepID=UPI0033FAEB90